MFTITLKVILIACTGFPSCRLVLMLMAFFAFLNIYCLRVNLSVALVAMVNSTYIRALDDDHHDDGVHGNATNSSIADPDAEVPCPEAVKKAAIDVSGRRFNKELMRNEIKKRDELGYDDHF